MNCAMCDNPECQPVACHGETLILCDRCRDRMRVWEVFHEQLPAIISLGHSDPYQALEILDDLYDRYRSLDHDSWLRKSIRSQRALILMDNKDYEGALRELRGVTELVAPDPDAFVANQVAIVDVLERSGQHDEALSEIESTLSMHERIDQRAILGLLSAYARLAKRKGTDIPEVHRDLVKRAVAAWGISVPVEILGSSLTVTVDYASLQEREAQERYTSLVQELRHQTQEERSRLLEEFIRVEPVSFYRELASRIGNDLDRAQRDTAGAPR